MLEILQRLDTRQDDLSFDKRKSRIELALGIGVPFLALLGTASAFYFNAQADIRQLKSEVAELKSAIALSAAQDRARLQGEIDKKDREIERLKK